MMCCQDEGTPQTNNEPSKNQTVSFLLFLKKIHKSSIDQNHESSINQTSSFFVAVPKNCSIGFTNYWKYGCYRAQSFGNWTQSVAGCKRYGSNVHLAGMKHVVWFNPPILLWNTIGEQLAWLREEREIKRSEEMLKEVDNEID